MVVFNHVNKVFPDGTVALNDVSLEIERGKFTVVLGPSGAGKTTLLRITNGLVEPSKGTVTLDGIKVVEENYNRVHNFLMLEAFH